MPNYRHVVEQAYREILKREPDPGGLEGWNEAMNAGTTEAQLREAFIRSEEYKERFPGEVTLPPPPPPPTDGGMALRVEGNLFVRSADGASVKLVGAVSCCADPDSDCTGAIGHGWPIATAGFVDLLAQHRMNYVPVRLGPMRVGIAGQGGESNPPGHQAYAIASGTPPDAVYDLNVWDEMYWSAMRGLCAYSLQRGVYVHVDLFDVWVAEHRQGPLRSDRNVQSYDFGNYKDTMRRAPDAVVERFIRKAVHELGRYHNVLWQDGNECFKGATPEWVVGMRNIVRDQESRDGYAHRPFGTNSHDEAIERQCDFGIWHEKPAPDPTTYPRLTNEYASETDEESGAYTFPPEAVLAQVRIAWRTPGIHYAYWRGSHRGADFLATLESIRKIVAGEDTAPPVPDECPPLVRWGSKIHNVLDAGMQQLPYTGGPTLPRGAVIVVVDSTERFGTGKGEPCNDEHPGCGGRKCEDPRGGLWTLEEHPSSYTGGLKIQANGFQARVGHPRTKQEPDAQVMTPGHYKLRVGPRPDCQDHEGKRVEVRGDASTTTEWDVS
jgi:hypothetical protein